MKGKKRLLFIAVKDAIDKWNPYGLLPDAPNDEFDNESKAVTDKINFESSIDDITRVISSVFSSSFEAKYFQTEDCIATASEVKQNIDRVRML